MEIRLLGMVTVVVDGHEVDAGPSRQRCVLAALAVDVGQVVSVERLIERVWGDRPPLRVRSNVLSYLSRLRLALTVGETSAIVRQSGGYSLKLDPGVVDLHVFRDLCTRARAAAGHPQRQASLWEQALELWRGEALTGLRGDWVTAERDRLLGEREVAEADLVDALLLLGHGESLVPRLAARAGAEPLNERVAAHYIHALHRAGRTADALAHYRHVQALLAEELGSDPGHALRELHQRVLGADPELDARPAVASGPPVPRQLPSAPVSFVGRQREVELLDSALTGGPKSTVVVSAVAGVGGIGKTVLALHWAHSRARRFPDGQLFVDLRGFSPDEDPMDPAVAVRGFLEALGVEPNRVPMATHAQTALYRSLVADKQMLVVLDNAASTAQVMPLLPSGANCVVVITSRHSLSGLIANHAVQHVALDVLSESEAHALLTSRLGSQRTAAEPAAVQELIEFCGGFTLALSVVASLATIRPDSRLADLAAELRTLGLTALDSTEPSASLPTVLSWSLRHLTDDQRRLFALLGISPGSDISLAAASRLAGTTEPSTYTMLRALVDASLVDRSRDGRYRMHDLVRAYAVTIASDVPVEEQELALHRVIDFYSCTAHEAELMLGAQNDDLRPSPPASSVTPLTFSDQAEALAWLNSEYTCALAAQRAAAAHSWRERAWHLAWNLNFCLERNGLHADQIAMWQLAADVMRDHENPVARILALQFMGYAHASQRDFEAALPILAEALELAERHSDRSYLARTHMALAMTLEWNDDLPMAFEHAQKALRLFQSLNGPGREANAHNAVAWIGALLKEYDTARVHAEAALALYLDHPKPDGEAATLHTLGYVENETGNYAAAIDSYRRACDIYRDYGYDVMRASTLADLGEPHEALGQIDKAAEVWQEAVRLYEDHGQEQNANRLRERLAALHVSAGATATSKPSDTVSAASAALLVKDSSG